MFEETSFPVSTRPVFDVVDTGYTDIFGRPVMDFVEIPNYKQIINAKENQTLSIMTKDYLAITDVEIMDRVLDLLDNAGIEVLPVRHHITRSKDGVLGRTTFMEVELPAYTLRAGSTEEQRMRLVIPNSYNGTLKLKLKILFWRLVCLNGAMGWQSDFEFGFKHRSGALERLGEALNLYLLDQMDHATNIMERLANEEGTVDGILAYLQNNKILGGERWQDKLMGHWLRTNSSTNLWDLYNLFTNEITHNFGRNYGSKLTRLEILNHEVKTVWGKVLGVQDSFETAILI